MPKVYAATRFQFHKGTIKTLMITAFLHCFVHFNSIKVQLKLTDKAGAHPYDADFNSIKVQLKQGVQAY